MRCLHRPGKLGLSSGVIDGWAFARPQSQALGAMDADFSHDINILPNMVAALESGEYGLAIGSRYVQGGGIANWPRRRIITSRVACALARPLTSVKDVTSGYFLVKREALEGVELDPIGFKIGLEVIAKGHYGRAIEIPYVFTDRIVGESKLNQKRNLQLSQATAQALHGSHLPGTQLAWRFPSGCAAGAAKMPRRDAALWTKCPVCGEVLVPPRSAANYDVCTKCGHHFRMGAYDRINTIIDGDFTEIGGDILPGDPLGWVDKKTYPVKLAGDREKSGISEGVVCGFGSIGGFEIALGVMDFHFRGGTMGTRRRRAHHAAVGRSAQAQRAMHHLYRVGRRAYGRGHVRADADGENDRRRHALQGRRQLLRNRADRSDDRRRFGVVCVSVRRDLAEPKAMIGFAGRRVIEQTIRQKLPDQFQTAEFLLEKGQIDMVVDRHDLKSTLVRLLEYASGGIGAKVERR